VVDARVVRDEPGCGPPARDRSHERDDEAVDDAGDVRYATVSGGARLAYRVRGNGPHEIVLVGSFLTNQDVDPQPSEGPLFEEGLRSFATVLSYDQLGTGVSDPVPPGRPPTLESWAGDLHAVMDAAGMRHAVVVGAGPAGPVAALYAATHPDRVRAAVLINTWATLARSDDYPAGVTPDVYERLVEEVEHAWGTGRFFRTLNPGRGPEEALRRVHARHERQGMSPATVGAMFRQWYAIDVRAALPVIEAPTLVIHSRDYVMPVAHGRYLAAHIPSARLLEVPGSDFPEEVVLGEIEELVTGTRIATDNTRMLATLLFTDVVGSTDRVVALGDRAWRSLLDRHDGAVRRQLARFSGRVEKFTGDGMLATFDGPGRAVRCATAIRDAARQVGLEIRVGIHTGEVERRGTELAGVAVHLAHRVCTTAQPGEVLVSRTVVDLVAGSGIAFHDRGEHRLKGIPSAWQLYAVTA
jgi:class 3 adenylate cyclase